MRLAEAKTAFARRYPFARIVRAYEDRNLNCECAAAAAGAVVYIEFNFGRDGKLSPNYAKSLYCAGCGATWHWPWKWDLWERLVGKLPLASNPRVAEGLAGNLAGESFNLEEN